MAAILVRDSEGRDGELQWEREAEAWGYGDSDDAKPMEAATVINGCVLTTSRHGLPLTPQ